MYLACYFLERDTLNGSLVLPGPVPTCDKRLCGPLLWSPQVMLALWGLACAEGHRPSQLHLFLVSPEDPQPPPVKRVREVIAAFGLSRVPGVRGDG